jgi:hypothetical protein
MLLFLHYYVTGTQVVSPRDAESDCRADLEMVFDGGVPGKTEGEGFKSAGSARGLAVKETAETVAETGGGVSNMTYGHMALQVLRKVCIFCSDSSGAQTCPD